MAHLSEDEGLIEAFKLGEDLHRFVGSRIFGVEPADVTPAMRSKVKAMSYGLVYGLSEYGLAKQLKISNAEAKQLMADYSTDLVAYVAISQVLSMEQNSMDTQSPPSDDVDRSMI